MEKYEKSIEICKKIMKNRKKIMKKWKTILRHWKNPENYIKKHTK